MRYDPSYQYNKEDIDRLYNELFDRDSKQAGADYWMNYANTSIGDGSSVTRDKLREAIIAGAKPGGTDYNYYRDNVLNGGRNDDPGTFVGNGTIPGPAIPGPVEISDPLPPPYEGDRDFNPADDTVPVGKGGAPTSGPGTVGYGKGGQDTAADLFRTGGARPMGPESYSPYSSGDYYRNTMNRQADVFGRPSYMYSQQQQSPYMPMQPYSMGSPYQDRMGKGGQGYNQRSPFGNPYGGTSTYDMMPPQTPYYQPPQRSPMKGGSYPSYQPYSGNRPGLSAPMFSSPRSLPNQQPMKGGQQPQMSPNKGATGGNTPLEPD